MGVWVVVLEGRMTLENKRRNRQFVRAIFSFSFIAALALIHQSCSNAMGATALTQNIQNTNKIGHVISSLDQFSSLDTEPATDDIPGGFFKVNTLLNENTGKKGQVKMVQIDQESVLFFDHWNHFVRCVKNHVVITDVVAGSGISRDVEEKRHCYYGNYEFGGVDAPGKIILSAKRLYQGGTMKIVNDRQEIESVDFKSKRLKNFASPYGKILDENKEHRFYPMNPRRTMKVYFREIAGLGLLFNTDRHQFVDNSSPVNKEHLASAAEL